MKEKKQVPLVDRWKMDGMPKVVSSPKKTVKKGKNKGGK